MLLVGHRGAPAYEPENTLRSFRKGMQLGANAIEFDTHVTKDGVPIVIHDHTLERTTNGKGPVHEKTLKELRKLNAGKGEKIPTVKETLLLLKNKAIPLVEIKDKDHVSELIDVVRKTGMADKIIMHSYNANALKEVKRLAPNIKTALIFQNKIQNLMGFMRLGKVIKIDWFFGRKDVVDKKIIEMAHKWKFLVQVWVVNTKAELQKFVKMNVDGIASDKPEIFKSLRK